MCTTRGGAGWGGMGRDVRQELGWSAEVETLIQINSIDSIKIRGHETLELVLGRTRGGDAVAKQARLPAAKASRGASAVSLAASNTDETCKRGQARGEKGNGRGVTTRGRAGCRLRWPQPQPQPRPRPQPRPHALDSFQSSKTSEGFPASRPHMDIIEAIWAAW